MVHLVQARWRAITPRIRVCIPACLYLLSFLWLIYPSLSIYFWHGHEHFFPLLRTKCMAELWAAQQTMHTPWMPDFCFGYGWPFFTFYAPLGYYVGAAAHLLLGLDYGDSVKVSFFLSMLVGGFAVYAFALLTARREGWRRGEWWGAAAATLYTLAPYHLTDVFVRTSLAESWGFAIVPLLFFSIETSKERPRAGFLMVAMSMNLLLLSHNVTALYGILFGILFVVLTAHRLSQLWLMGFAFIFGFCLSAYFSIPAKSLMRHVGASDMAVMFAYPTVIKANAVYWSQHLIDVYDKGYSLPGPSDTLGIQIGRLILLGALAAAAATVGRSMRLRARIHIFIYLLLTLLVLFICSPQMPWDTVPKTLHFIQFPWRILIFANFFACAAIILAAPFIDRWIHPLAVMIIASLLYIPPVAAKLHITDFTHVRVESDQSLPKFFEWSENARSYAGCTAVEYFPAWVRQQYSYPEFHLATPAPPHRLTALRGDIEIKAYRHAGARYEWDYKASSGVDARIHVFDFPGWELRIDGEPAQEGRIGRDVDGLVSLRLPAGQHTASLTYTLSPVGKKAMRLTQASWVLWLGLAVIFFLWSRLGWASRIEKLVLRRIGSPSRELAALPPPEGDPPPIPSNRPTRTVVGEPEVIGVE